MKRILAGAVAALALIGALSGAGLAQHTTSPSIGGDWPTPIIDF